MHRQVRYRYKKYLLPVLVHVFAFLQLIEKYTSKKIDKKLKRKQVPYCYLCWPKECKKGSRRFHKKSIIIKPAIKVSLKSCGHTLARVLDGQVWRTVHWHMSWIWRHVAWLLLGLFSIYPGYQVSITVSTCQSQRYSSELETTVYEVSRHDC